MANFNPKQKRDQRGRWQKRTFLEKAFTRELERLRGYETAALLIEARLETIQAGKYRSRIAPDAAVQSIISFMGRYRLPVFFAPDRTAREHFIYDFLRHYVRHAGQRYKALEQMGGVQ